MLPVVYSGSSTEFSSNGQGVLIDCISCSVTEERNGIFEMELTYPEHGQHADKLVVDAIIKATAHRGDEGQLFRIYSIEKNLAGDITCQCQHISYQLSFIPCEPFTATRVSEALSGIRAHMQSQDDGFTFWTNKTTTANFKLKVPSSTKSVLGGMDGSILDTFRGEYEFDNKQVKLWNNRGQDRGVVLRYGKNITDIKQESNIAEVYTGFRPYYYDEEELVELATADKCVWCENAGSFPYQRVMVMDCTSEFEELVDSAGDKRAPTQAELLTYANKYLSDHDFGVPKVSVDVDFEALWDTPEYEDVANLEVVNLCDTVHVLFDAYDISVKSKVTRTVYDSLQERYSSITVGSISSTFSDAVASIPEKTSSMIAETSTRLELAQQRATATLLGRNGGFKVEKMNGDGQIIETLFMDTLNESTATKVWRWNINGLGYSPNGPGGPYTVAMTKDGEIVADFITTGTLDANEVDIVHLKAQNVLIDNSTTVAGKFGTVDTTLSSHNTRITANTNGLSSEVTNRKMATPAVNLLPSTYYRELVSGKTYTAVGITWTVNPDGSITANGTATNIAQFYLNNFTGNIGPIRLDPAKKYRLHGCPSGGSNAKWRLGGKFYKADQDPSDSSGGTYIADYGSGVTIPVDYTYAVIYSLRIESGVTVNNLTWYPMLEVGDEDHAYASTHNGSYGLVQDMTTRFTQTAESITAVATRTTAIEKTGTGNLLRNAGTLKDWPKNSTCSTTGIAGSNDAATAIVSGHNYANFSAVSTVSWRSIESPKGDLGIPYELIRNKTITVSWFCASPDAASLNGTNSASKNVLLVALSLHKAGNTARTRYATVKLFSSATAEPYKLTTAWKRFSVTLNITDDWFATWDNKSNGAADPGVRPTDIVFLQFYNYSPYRAYFCCPQIELGSTATEWAPMPGENSIAKAEASIQLNADAIESKVSTTDYNGDTIASKINQTATTVTINASKINLNGAVTANNNVKIGTDGKITAVNADITGKITATSGSFSGEITAAKGKIGKYTITSTYLYTGSGSTQAGIGGNQAFWAGAESSNSAPFRVSYGGALVATNATITGKITATALTLESGVTLAASKVSGLSKVATSGKYSDLSATPDLTIYIAKDGTIGTTPASGKTGFKVSSAGLLTASNAVIYGTVYASGGKIAGWTIGSTSIYKNTTIDGLTHQAYISAPATASAANSAFGVSKTASDGTVTYPFLVQYNGKLTATNADIIGKITSSSGTIGGWGLSTTEIGKTFTETVSSTNLIQHRALLNSPSSYNSGNVAFSVRSRSSTNGGSSYSSWSNQFYVTYGGKLYASNADIKGKITATSGTIGGCTISDGVLTVKDANIESINGQKVGSGINGGNISTGTVAEARIDTALLRTSKLSATIAELQSVTIRNLIVGVGGVGGLRFDRTKFVDRYPAWTYVGSSTTLVGKYVLTGTT